MMKKIGIVGGVGWPSTVDYYRLICTASNAHFKAIGTSLPHPTPPMTIESLVMHETRGYRAKPGDSDKAWARYDGAFRGALQRLQRAGCDFGIIANNTSHTRLRSIRKGLSLPIISILEETADAARIAGARNALILGTDVTMRADDYASVLIDRGIMPNARLPEHVIDGLQSLIDTEFEQRGTELGRRMLIELCDAHVVDRSSTVVLLACTELPLAFSEYSDAVSFVSDGYHFINTTAAHALAALQAALGNRPI
jgi:aspartate racemase